MWAVLPLIKKFLPHLLVSIAVLGLGYYVYNLGYSRGSKDVQLKWEQDKVASQEAINQLRSEYEKREIAAHTENLRITNELVKARQDHESALAEQRADYEQRLLQSEDRASVYQRKARSGSAGCRYLADHAARLDRSLEEGRSLVRELGSTLRLREQQLRGVGLRLINDHKLIMGDSNG